MNHAQLLATRKTVVELREKIELLTEVGVEAEQAVRAALEATREKLEGSVRKLEDKQSELSAQLLAAEDE
ncbi:MAG: hypothetical protein FJ095_15245 [Deltaproteobacteria bacterium]|nr:hypothetical protein [Deltaproteobacteria bacterium]